MPNLSKLLQAEKKAAEAAQAYREGKEQFSFDTESQPLKEFLKDTNSKVIPGTRLGGESQNKPYLRTNHGVVLWIGRSLRDAGICTEGEVHKNLSEVMVSKAGDFFSLYRDVQGKMWDE